MARRRGIIPPVPIHKRGRRRHSNFRPRKWDVQDFSCSEEVLMWRLGSDWVLLYGDVFMPKLSDLLKGAKKATGPAASDPDADNRWPCLVLLLTATLDDDGHARETATLTLVAEGGLWKAGVRDRTANASLWRSGSTVMGVFDALEAALEAGTADWRSTEGRSRK